VINNLLNKGGTNTKQMEWVAVRLRNGYNNIITLVWQRFIVPQLREEGFDLAGLRQTAEEMHLHKLVLKVND